MGKNILKNVIIFIVIFLAINLIFNAFNKNSGGESLLDKNEIGIQVSKEIPLDKTVIVELKNNTKENIAIKNACPHNPLEVYKYINDAWQKIESHPKMNCSEATDFIIMPGKTLLIPYDKWNHSLFGEIGKYKISLTAKIGNAEKTFESNEFQIIPQGFWRKLWNNFFYHPIYNTLIVITNILPYKDFGFAIIILTIIIRLLLYIPSRKALESQKRMQEIQPEIDRLKEKYKGNQQLIGQETMRIFKENKVNPFGGCLPILIQFPFLIAIFYVVQNGLNVDNSYMIYGFLKGITLDNINIMFLGVLDLTRKNPYILPLIIGGLQFLQMKLSFIKGKQEEKSKSETQSVNKMMLYFMPVMIAIFTASVPAGVGLYWGTSTLFSIVQQYFVNKKKTDEPVVKVIAKQ